MRRPDWRTIASYLLAALKRSAGVIRRTVPRAYALAVMALIGWTTWRAVSYLVVSLIRPSAAPAAITELLDGAAGPFRDIVLLNAAAALIIAERAGDLGEGLRAAAKAVDSGAAKATLERLIAVTNEGTPG